MGVSAGKISVVGTPAPQGNKSAFPYTGKDGRQHVKMVEGRTKQSRLTFDAWRQAVARESSEWVKRNLMTPPIDGAVELTIEFYMARPQSTPKRVKYPIRKPDGDKLLRTVLDSMTGIIFTDDARVYKFSVVKLFADGRPPGAEISWAAH